MNIRPMLKKDLSTVADIFMQVFNDFGERWIKKSALFHVDCAYDKDFSYVLEVEDKQVGFLIMAIVLHEDGREIYVDSLGVLKEYQNQGFGKALWEKVSEIAKKEKIGGIRLLAKKGSQAYLWYQKMGFVGNEWVELFKTI